MKSILKHAAEFLADLRAGHFQSTPQGIVFPEKSVRAHGYYYHSVNGRDLQVDHNIIPDAAILSILNVYFGGTAKLPAWYLALFSGAVTPGANLTAANFAATLTEITSNTEGYSEATRPQWTPDPASGGSIDNLSAKAQFTIVASSSITVEGGALVSDNTKGGTSGVLGSAGRFANARQLFNGENFELGYSVSLDS